MTVRGYLMSGGAAALAMIASPALAVPTVWTANFGSAILSGDDSTTLTALNGTFSLFGSTYNDGVISTNGFITFGGSNGSGCCNGNVNELLSGAPRIAAEWQDWNPTTVYRNDLTAGQTVFTWVGGEYARGGNMATQLTLFSNGNFIMGFDGPSIPVAHNTLTGVSPGGGSADPGATNFSAISGQLSTGTTAYQQFCQGTFNLNQSNLYFTAGSDGFSISTSGLAGGVPEPATWAMLILGFGVVGGAMRRRHSVNVRYA